MNNLYRQKLSGMYWLVALASVLPIYSNDVAKLIGLAHVPAYEQNIRWKWDQLPNYPATGKDFPKGFLLGAGTSAYQVEGNCTNSSYHGFTKTEGYKELAGIGCDHENRYKEDIALMANELKLDVYRFSIERSKLEKAPGLFDEKVLKHYANVCDELIKNNIKPAIGLHHYSDPQWFIAAGGFADSKNIPGFVNFCATVFDRLQEACAQAMAKYHKDANAETRKKLMPLYLTFNSPSSYCANGYLTGVRPPGKKGNGQTMAIALKNMLEAHVQIYQKLKKLPGGANAHIGITHNIYQIEPYNKYNFIQRLRCYYANQLVNDSVLNFFATGIFHVNVPFTASVKHINKLACSSLDVIGLNYYCHGYMGTSDGPHRPTHEITTDNPRYTIYAEGMHRAIREISERVAKRLNIPIIVTENGIATTDDTKHDLFSKRYLYAINRAIKDGHNVIGYIRWSFMDNYEWGNYDQRFGLYYVDRTTKDEHGNLTLARKLKKGAQYFVDLIAEHKRHYA